MKATVNNSANFVINNDMLNETKCLKYVSKPTMLEDPDEDDGADTPVEAEIPIIIPAKPNPHGDC